MTMNPPQLRQTIDHYLNQLSLTHLQVVAQMVTYLAGRESSPINPPVLDWSKIIPFLELPTIQEVQIQEMTWEQLRTTMSPFASSQLETPDTPSICPGKLFSLEEMDKIIHQEASKRVVLQR